LRARRPTRTTPGAAGERGSALIIALVMIVTIGLMSSAALTYANTGLRASSTAVGPDLDSTFAAGGAIDLATRYLQDNASVGVAGGASCGDPANFDGVVSVAASGSAPAIDVRCRPASGSGAVAGGNGAVSDTTPANAILALGTRNTEPGPLNNYPLDSATVYNTSSWGERGIDLQKSSTGGSSTVRLNGSVYSNAPLRRDATSGALTATGTISARGACENVAPCTVVPYTTAATATPAYPTRSPDLTPRTVPACPASTLVTFAPGWYSSASAMNDLFASCKDHDFWFQPGTYYFDFRDTSGGAQCRPQSASASDALHEWCIGPDANSKSRVVGGTPLGWSTGSGNASATLGTFGWSLPWPGGWANEQNALTYGTDNATFSWAQGTGTSLSLFDPSPAVDDDGQALTDLELDVASAVTAGASARYVWVWKGFGLCGIYPVTANAATISGLESCIGSVHDLNQAWVTFSTDPSTSNGTVAFGGVRFRAEYAAPPDRAVFPNGCDPSASGVQWIFGGDSRVYVSDGTLELCAGPNPSGTSTNQMIAVYGVPPTPPVTPTAAAATSGQNSWATVTNASNALDIAEQSGIADATIQVAPKCGNKAGQISCFRGSGSGTAYGSVKFEFPAFDLPANTKVQRVALRASYNSGAGSFASGTAPEFVISKTGTGAFTCSADSTMPATDQTSAWLRPVSSCLTPSRLATGFSIEWRARKSVTCSGRNCGSAFTQTVDGLEVIVTLDPATPATAVVMPEDGCIAPVPNDYTAGRPLTNRYGPNAWEGDGAPDCALLKWDAVPRTSGNSSEVGCYSGQVSLQGTLYAPGAAVDFDQAGPKASGCNASSPTYTSWSYPIFGRGAILRTLRIRGMRASAGQSIGTCGAATCGGSVQDRVVTFQARVGTTTKVTAQVRFPAAGGAPQVESWTVS
jgi:hypothetical protein